MEPLPSSFAFSVKKAAVFSCHLFFGFMIRISNCRQFAVHLDMRIGCLPHVEMHIPAEILPSTFSSLFFWQWRLLMELYLFYNYIINYINLLLSTLLFQSASCMLEHTVLSLAHAAGICLFSLSFLFPAISFFQIILRSWVCALAACATLTCVTVMRPAATMSFIYITASPNSELSVWSLSHGQRSFFQSKNMQTSNHWPWIVSMHDCGPVMDCDNLQVVQDRLQSLPPWTGLRGFRKYVMMFPSSSASLYELLWWYNMMKNIEKL